MNDLKLFVVLVIILRIIIFFYRNVGGSDYDAAVEITATFVHRHGSVTIPIPIVTGDAVVELPEYFTVELFHTSKEYNYVHTLAQVTGMQDTVIQ